MTAGLVLIVFGCLTIASGYAWFVELEERIKEMEEVEDEK